LHHLDVRVAKHHPVIIFLSGGGSVVVGVLEDPDSCRFKSISGGSERYIMGKFQRLAGWISCHQGFSGGQVILLAEQKTYVFRLSGIGFVEGRILIEETQPFVAFRIFVIKTTQGCPPVPATRIHVVMGDRIVGVAYRSSPS